MIKIVTDSGSGITPEVARQFGVTVVPLYVHFGTETFREGVDLELDEFLSRLKVSAAIADHVTAFGGRFLGGLQVVDRRRKRGHLDSPVEQVERHGGFGQHRVRNAARALAFTWWTASSFPRAQLTMVLEAARMATCRSERPGHPGPPQADYCRVAHLLCGRHARISPKGRAHRQGGRRCWARRCR